MLSAYHQFLEVGLNALGDILCQFLSGDWAPRLLMICRHDLGTVPV